MHPLGTSLAQPMCDFLCLTNYGQLWLLDKRRVNNGYI